MSRGAYESVTGSDRRRPHPRLPRATQAVLDVFSRERLAHLIAHSVRNDPEGRTLIRRLQDYTVGPDGPRHKAKSGDAEYDRKIERLWKEYTKLSTGPFRIDATGLHTLAGMACSVLDQQCVEGRCGGVLVTKGPGAGGVQLIEGIRIRNRGNRQDDETHFAGVEVAPNGPPLAYHVADWLHGGLTLGLQTHRVPAESFLYMPQRMDPQVGVYAPEPMLGVSTRSTEALNEMCLGVVQAVTTQSASAMVHQDSGEDDIPPEGAGTDRSQAGYGQDEMGREELRVDRSAAGVIFRLRAGEKLESLNSTFPSQAVGPFIELQLTRIAMTMGISRQLLTADFSGMSFSAAKMVLAAYRATRDRLHEGLVQDFYQPVYRFFVDMCITHRLVRPPRGQGADPYACTFSPPEMPEPDPPKMIQAQGYALTNGMTTWDEFLAPRGVEFKEHADRLAKEIEYCRSIGVTHPMDRDAARAGRDLGEYLTQRELDDAGGGRPGEDGAGRIVEHAGGSA